MGPFPEEQNPVHSSEVLSMKQKVEKIAAAVFNLFREKIGKSTSIGFSFKLRQGHFETTHDPFSRLTTDESNRIGSSRESGLTFILPSTDTSARPNKIVVYSKQEVFHF